MILEGKRVLITGILTHQSIAYTVAEEAINAGAEVIATSFGRPRRLTERAVGRLPKTPDVLELDVNEPSHYPALAEELNSRWGGLDGVLHAVAYAPRDAFGGVFLDTPAESASTAFSVSAFSYKELARALLPLLEPDGEKPGGSVVGLDFDATVAWAAYDWMGVAKAALESINRYLARDLGPRGVRANLIAAGPLDTPATSGIAGMRELVRYWDHDAPLGWDRKDARPVARAACFLLSDWSEGISGEIIHVDGGLHAMAPRTMGA